MSDPDDSERSDATPSEATPDDREAAPVDEQEDERPAVQEDDRETASLDDETVPMERIAADVRERRQREQDTESDPFEEMAVEEEIDGELLWEDLLSEEEMSEAERAVGAGASATEVGPDTREEHVVEKDQFCGRCPYLTEPPMLACEHDGTEIVEVADSDHFRVRNCPFAARDDDQLAEFD
jgi:hypothetical protein